MAHPSESVTFSNCDGRERDELQSGRMTRLKAVIPEEAGSLLEFEPTCKRSQFPDGFVPTWFARLSVEYLSALSAF